MFPNKHNVYIHDTPAKELFKKTERGFSSGCIRIEKPTELAEYVLKTDPKWTRAKIIEAINIGKEQTIRLPETIPVHLLYWTAWADDKGAIQFRNDIYERDADLNAALFEKPPSK
jgi:murein L,D-transpeptidase YcbB/YkuD